MMSSQFGKWTLENCRSFPNLKVQNGKNNPEINTQLSLHIHPILMG